LLPSSAWHGEGLRLARGHFLLLTLTKSALLVLYDMVLFIFFANFRIIMTSFCFSEVTTYRKYRSDTTFSLFENAPTPLGVGLMVSDDTCFDGG
jgi:hypothetical protein